MKRHLKILLFLICLTTLPQWGWAEKKIIKVACIGNSITYGYNIVNREKNAYPAQLQAYLGEDYDVRNFGISGATLLNKGNIPYMALKAYKESLSYNPDIVLIKLGTNDSKPYNWKYKNEFYKDYQQLIDSYRKLPSSPRIILLSPVRCYKEKGHPINDAVISQGIIPIVEKLAYDNQLEIIDLYHLFGKEWVSFIFPDRLHPSSIGAGSMAQKIGNYLKQEKTAKQSHQYDKAQQPFSFHGYQGYSFKHKGIACKIVEPKVKAKGKPWLLRARFWGHEPQTDIALLEAGFHIAYCDVEELYGAEEAIQRWDNFYKWMKKKGFQKKVVLEGMSRGGLIVYNWAARHPQRVACIYADAPVLDLKSWPMGKGIGKGSDKCTERMLKAYGFKNKEEALRWNQNPLDHAATAVQIKN